MTRYHRLAGEDACFLTGTDEHGDKIAQAAASGRRSAPQAMADQNSDPVPQTPGTRSASATTTTSARPRRATRRSCRRCCSSCWDAGEIYLGKYGGHYCYGCERFYTEKEIVDGKCPDHLTAADVDRGGELLLQDVEVPGLADRHDPAPARPRPPRALPQRGARLPARSAAGPLHQPAAHASRVGHPAAVRRQVRHLRLVRRAHQLRLGARRAGRRAVREVLAARPAPDRQGHPQAARDLLAVHAEGGRHRPLPAPQRPRLLDDRGAEDVQVARQRLPGGARRPRSTASTPTATSCCAR